VPVACLQAYAVGFFAIPLVRWLRNRSRNAEIEQQNADRRQAAAMLVGKPFSTQLLPTCQLWVAHPPMVLLTPSATC
jgi:hypothetical protein